MYAVVHHLFGPICHVWNLNFYAVVFNLLLLSSRIECLLLPLMEAVHLLSLLLHYHFIFLSEIVSSFHLIIHSFSN